MGQIRAQHTAVLVGQIVANGEETRRAMDLRFRQHEELTATIQRGYDEYNRTVMRGLNEQQRMADDWCDTFLGVQKRVDPSTGTMYKTDSNFTYDWVNAEGHHQLSNDINFNPNGLGTGNWTLSTNVH